MPECPMVFVRPNVDPVFSALPQAARTWLRELPWAHRRHILSLCQIMSASSPEMQAEFLDSYTSDGLLSQVTRDQDTRQKVSQYLEQFHIQTQLTDSVLRDYIRQLYRHIGEDIHQQPDLYLKSVLKLAVNPQEKSSLLNYVLGFELIQTMFQMSWAQQERLYHLQTNQEEFLRQYIKPIQATHRANGIIVPRDEGQFFARRSYFVKRPCIEKTPLVALVMATFTTAAVIQFGFSIIRMPNAFEFDYEYIFAAEPVDAIVE